MKDTSEEFSALYNAMFSRLSLEERALMGCAMHDFSKKIVLSQLESAEKTRAVIMSEIFNRFYGNEFQGARLKCVLKALCQYHSDPPTSPTVTDGP